MIIPNLQDVSPLAEAIQLSVAPVFLLTGVAGMLNALGARIARVTDRVRVLEDRLLEAEPGVHPRKMQYDLELQSLMLRRNVINGATALMVICSVLIGLTVVELFYSTGIQGRLQVSQWVTVTFISGFVCFIAACTLYLAEILIASRSVAPKR